MKNFGGLPEKYSSLPTSEVVILPVPYDGTSTWIKGADQGPSALIEASENMELYDIETDSECYLKGIFTAAPVNENETPETMAQAVCERVNEYLHQNKFVVTVGGEHSVSIGAIEAHASFFKELTIVQIDAHADLRDTYMGSRYNHACVMARAQELAPVIQTGIRSMSAEEKKEINRERVFYSYDIRNNKNWIQEILNLLTKNVYITFDLDALDPAIMPSTGTPEPGGMEWHETLQLLKAICRQSNLVGCDVVELCPNPTNKAPDFLAAKLIYKILSYR